MNIHSMLRLGGSRKSSNSAAKANTSSRSWDSEQSERLLSPSEFERIRRLQY